MTYTTFESTPAESTGPSSGEGAYRVPVSGWYQVGRITTEARSTQYSCPIDSCGWRHDTPSVADPDILADTEQRAAQHLEAHTTAEWAAEVKRLRRVLAVAEQEGWRA
ncbi:hypothetical protein [Embleya sp. NPDC005971]|uniref:hypothetical protein n=1 Tax=Embleya sp. NPDC005971 TaxID=3156724 RepID=UPI0033D72250